MTKFIVTALRAGIIQDPMVKAGLSHKYLKREPYFVGGKMRYRYYYDTPEDRERYRRDHDPSEKHEHHVKNEAHRVHPTLKKDSAPTVSLNGPALATLLSGTAPHGKNPSVHISKSFEEHIKQPDVDAEANGIAPTRNPTQRIAKAFDMLTGPARDMMTINRVNITSRDDRSVKAKFEQGDPPRPVPAAFSTRDGEVVICADVKGNRGVNTSPTGAAKFGSGLTLTEEIVWSELGRQIRYGLANKRKEVWERWKSISDDHTNGDVRVSTSAYTSLETDFMESFACGMSHPKQLAQQAPERYKFMQENGLISGPPLDQVLAEPAANQAWWEGRKQTKAQQFYQAMRTESQDAPQPVPYISPKDEFFQVSMGGRTVYLRVGPPSPDQESNWESMPDVIDKRTGLPTYDKTVAGRFRARENIKEVFDEHGNRLDDTSAYFFLNQDNAAVKLPETLGEYNKQPAASKATHGLAYQMYIGLGESTGSADAEHEQITKMKVKGQDPAEKRADRWAKVPHKITMEEFHAKTPSFAFQNLNVSAKQPYKALEGGKPVLHRNPATGRMEEKLHARIYESVNPDGSVFQLTVQESPSFQYGETVRVPVTTYTKDEETGEVTERTAMQDVVLDPREHSDISPKGLSKQYKMPINDILQANNRFGQYQLHDPVMAALINPSGAAIRDHAAMLSMLKSAAEARPRAWVSVQVGSDIPPSSVHLQVMFDGAGSPRIMGDYWEKKLGIVNPRLSDLVDAGRLKGVERAKMKKPRRPKIKPGSDVRVKVDGRWVFATMHEKTVTEGGKRNYEVTLHEGQGFEPPLTVDVAQVRSVPSDLDPKRPNIRIREPQQPASDLLVYVDEVRVNSKGDPIPGTGLLKVMLPASGAWNFETMVRAPGVTTNDKGELVLDPARMDVFREYAGAFIMDDLAQVKLNSVAQRSRAKANAGGTGVTPMTDIVDPLNGNRVNVNGLLKGCREKIGDRYFELGDHQAELLKAMADNDGRIIGAHFMGTGKTVSAICAVKMMQNLKTPDGKPHPNRPKRVAIVVPKNTARQWIDAVAQFTEGTATLVGSSALSGAAQMATLPANLKNKPVGWSDEKYAKALKDWREESLKSNPNLWRAEEDSSDIVVISQEYFTQHADELKRLGGFDGIIVDEAHGIQKENERSKKVESWNPDMKMMMLLTGTPITNTLNSVPRYLNMISNGEIKISDEEFSKEYLVESAVMKANGAKNAARMDLNPQKAAQLGAMMKPYMHVATTADVRGKTIPAVALDENNPQKMEGVQSTLYRGYMGALSDDDRRMLELAATLGEDEEKLLSEDAKRKIGVARNITNAIGYKPTDGREFITFEEWDPPKKDGGKPTKKVTLFKLPTMQILAKKYKGKWPSLSDVEKGRLSLGEYETLAMHAGVALGRSYEELAGKSVSATTSTKEYAAIESGEPMKNGLRFGAKVNNPEYGPEGAICRGVLAPGKGTDIEYHIRNPDGSVKETVRVPQGLRFVRDPARKSSGLYYFGGLPEGHPDAKDHDSDWDFAKITAEDEGKWEGEIRKTQKPKEARKEFDVQRHPERRRERLMFDLTMTTGNAKSDALENYISEKTNPATGGDPDRQLIVFGQSIGSSVRAIESKMRLMGYKDVNEALNDSLSSKDDYLYPKNGKYYVTYMGDEATLGDRDVNSEIFKKRKSEDGSDTKMSMFVHRALNGTSGDKLPGVGKIAEGWNKDQRAAIKANFSGLEMPLRVTAQEVNGRVQMRYAYESEMSAADRSAFNKLDDQIDRATGDAKTKLQDQQKSILSKYWSAKEPLTEKQQHVFNNCQMMVASDAAQVGLNWGNATDLVMYDSLFSPMNEWQRITRAARMLPPAIADKVKPIFDKLGTIVEEKGKSGELAAHYGSADEATAMIQDVLNQHPDLAQELLTKTGMSPASIVESFLAARTIDKINAMRGPVEQRLRATGRQVTEGMKITDPKTGEERHQFVQAAEITSADVMNEIVQELLPFEKAVLRSRKYLVNVKRLTTSVSMPEMMTVKVVNEETGKKETRTVPTGNMVDEHPSRAERSVLTQGRAKQVPYERFLNLVQTAQPVTGSFDFLPSSVSRLSQFAKPLDQVRPSAEDEARQARLKQEAQDRRASDRDRAKQAAAQGKAKREAEKKEKAALVTAAVKLGIDKTLAAQTPAPKLQAMIAEKMKPVVPEAPVAKSFYIKRS